MQKRITTTILLSVVIILISLGIISHVSVEESIQHSLQNRKELASTIANYFDQLLQTNTARLYDISLSGLVNYEDQDLEPERKILKDIYQYSLFSDGVFLTDLNGKIVLDYPKTHIKQMGDLVLSEIKESIEKKIPIVSGVHTMPDTQKKVLFVFVPLKDEGGNIVGVAGGEINPTTHIFNNVIRSVPTRNEAIIELVDKNGVVIASNNPMQIFSCSDHNRVLSNLIQQKEQAVLKCHRCHSDDDRQGLPTEDKKTTDMLAFAPLSEAPWGVTVREPKDHLFAPSRHLKQKFFILALIAIGSALILAMGMSRSIVAPIHSLIKATKKIASGELKEPIEIASKDEIGELGESFEIMRKKLHRSIQEIQTYNQALEERVQVRTKELQKNRERLANMLKKIISAQEEERQRIARELHDETSQAIAALGVSLEIATLSLKENKLTVADMGNLQTKVSHLIDGVNRLIQDLRPPVLDDLGLTSGVRWLLERHLAKQGIRYRLTVPEPLSQMLSHKQGSLDEKTELMLFRIIQEAIINVSKHAQASDVFVSIERKGSKIQILITDDGIGFDVANVFQNAEVGKQSGYGIIGLRERITLLDGTLHIDSKQGVGTRMNITIPISGLVV